MKLDHILSLAKATLHLIPSDRLQEYLKVAEASGLDHVVLTDNQKFAAVAIATHTIPGGKPPVAEVGAPVPTTDEPPAKVPPPTPTAPPVPTPKPPLKAKPQATTGQTESHTQPATTTHRSKRVPKSSPKPTPKV